MKERSASAPDDLASPASSWTPPTPGKRTLTQSLQRQASGGAADADRVQERAGMGVAGTGGSLPFLDTIQRSFGPHDVSGVVAHTDGAAASAATGIGATAYATGNHVAFAGTPDLHTTAHEAAHVVQQRAGVHLKGGVGESGDAYERHADAVADRVVQGLSAASLLGDDAHAGASSTGVQRKDVKPSKADEKKAHDQFESDGPTVVHALAGVLGSDNGAEMRSYMPARYLPAMNKLVAVNQGVPDGRVRRAMFEEVAPIFEPFVRNNDHFGGPDVYLPEHWKNLRDTVIFSEARSRVAATVVVNDGKEQQAIEIPDDKHPREQGEVLGITLPKLVESIKKTVERAKAFGEKAGVSAEMLERLEVAENALNVYGGYLKLSDEEFQKEINEHKGVLAHVKDYSELLKVVLEIGRGAIGLTLSASGMLMKAVGDEAMVEACKEAGEHLFPKLDSVIGAVEIVHGLSVMLDSSASHDDRIGGGVEVAAGVATLATGSSLGALPIMGPYALVKAAQYLYSGAVIGFETGTLREVFGWMQGQAQGIGATIDRVAAVGLLVQGEKDPERRAALQTQEKILTKDLRDTLGSFLERCDGEHDGLDRADPTAPLVHYPGNFTILAEAFVVPVRHLAGARSEPEIVALAHEVVRQIVWCFNHGPAIVKGHATGKHVEDMDAMEEKIEKDAKKD